MLLRDAEKGRFEEKEELRTWETCERLQLEKQKNTFEQIDSLQNALKKDFYSNI